MPPVYFDYNATTPIDPIVREAMLPYLELHYGNPSSVHRLGRTARAHLDAARERTAKVLSAKPSEITFTSGGTESNNTAVIGTAHTLRAKGRHLVTSPTEHPAVLRAFEYLATHEGFELTLLPVNQHGMVDPGDVEKALRTDTILVSVMMVNNETGVIQPVADISRICHDRDILFHTDAVQAFGKLPLADILAVEADLLSLCAHKFHGPKGAGLLRIRSPLRVMPILHGGSQENESRAGTENLAALMGLATAMERHLDPPVFSAIDLIPFVDRIRKSACDIDNVIEVAEVEYRVGNTISLIISDCDSLTLLAALDLESICASSGSACSAGSLEPSHVLLAQGYTHEQASSFVRFSLGRESTDSEVTHLERTFPKIVARIRDV